MTAKIQITVPDLATTKKDEIAILKKIVDGFRHSNSYLEALFSPDLLRWASAQIESDFLPNVIEHLEEEEKTTSKAQAFTRELQSDIEALNLKLRKQEEAFARERAQLNDKIAKLNGNIEQLCATVSAKHEDIGRVSQNYYDQVRIVQEKNEQLDEKDREIVKLKVFIADRFVEEA